MVGVLNDGDGHRRVCGMRARKIVEAFKRAALALALTLASTEHFSYSMAAAANTMADATHGGHYAIESLTFSLITYLIFLIVLV